jgi:hypothetical protein
MGLYVYKTGTEGAWAFRPLKPAFKKQGFSHGLFAYASAICFAPQEART